MLREDRQIKRINWRTRGRTKASRDINGDGSKEIELIVSSLIEIKTSSPVTTSLTSLPDTHFKMPLSIFFPLFCRLDQVSFFHLLFFFQYPGMRHCFLPHLLSHISK